MRCPYCGRDKDRVIDSRSVQDGKGIRRRRACRACRKRFTTYEYIERAPITVIKRDGRTEPYDRNKLMAGIVTACRKRPIGRERIERLVDEIETSLADEYRTEVRSTDVGKRVLRKLAELDQISYVRFASVYRQFEDVDEFVEELNRLRRERTS